ncbi:MAG: FHA domain-containing protein, partial [Planctomycetaceae bacterium]|nr:FHA domain-containing protein [Planctomycetaceae bacterium]
MDIQLVVAGGSKAGQVIPITGPKFIIGRADDCNLKPRSELISRYHCAIIVEDNYVAIRDLGSKNGVFINGTRVATEQELQHSDKISVGPLEFFVHLSVTVNGQK